MSPRSVVTAAAVLAASVLPIQAAQAAYLCLGATPQFQGSSLAEGILVHENRWVVNMSGGPDDVFVEPEMTPKAIICMGSGDDEVVSRRSGSGAPVLKLDGGSGKDYATISACFWDGQPITVRDVERLTIVPCGQE